MFILRWFVLPPILLAIGFGAGWRVQGWRNTAQALQAEQHVVAVVRRQGAVATAVAVKDRAAEDRIGAATGTLIRDIPDHVTPASDLRFPLPVGLVRVHDAAALGLDLSAVPDPAGQPDDAASGVAASAAASVIAANYGDCRVEAERLSNLQDWITAEMKASNGAP
jgi:hypothetical protein